MKAKQAEDTKQEAAPRLAWTVVKVPPGETTLKAGAVRAGAGATLMLTREQADAVNAALPGALQFAGI